MPIELTSTPLFLKSKQGRALCNGLYIRAEPGTVTGIMGPAGAGKSVFLKLMAGYTPPDQGCIHMNGADLYRNFDALKEQIGYVPQAEIMPPELTVAVSLDFRLRLHARLARSIRQERIKSVCTKLGFSNKLEQILHQKIGSPDSIGDYPSGGERRRINIAHELIGEPSILFLDEPTSGLATGDAEVVVNLLRGLADESGVTVVLTIHQPSREVFALFDDLLMIAKGGSVAYYGRAPRATEYFQQVGGIRFPATHNPAEFVMDFVREQHIGEWAAGVFAQSISRPEFPFLKRLPVHSGVSL